MSTENPNQNECCSGHRQWLASSIQGTSNVVLSTKTWWLMYPLIAAFLLQTCLNGIYIGDVCRSLPKEIAIFNKVWDTRRFSTGWNEIIITWSWTLVPFTDSREFLRGSPPCSKPHQQSGKCPVVPFLSTMTMESHTLFTSPCLVWWPQNFTHSPEQLLKIEFVVCWIGWLGWIYQPAPVLCQPQRGWQVGWKWAP